MRTVLKIAATRKQRGETPEQKRQRKLEGLKPTKLEVSSPSRRKDPEPLASARATGASTEPTAAPAVRPQEAEDAPEPPKELLPTEPQTEGNKAQETKEHHGVIFRLVPAIRAVRSAEPDPVFATGLALLQGFHQLRGGGRAIKGPDATLCKVGKRARRVKEGLAPIL